MWRSARTALAPVAVGLGLGLAACGTTSTRSTGVPGSGAGTGPAQGSSPSVGPAGLAVSPRRGGPHTTFALAFTAPASAKPVGGSRIGYAVAVTGGATGSCIGTRSLAVSSATKGLPVSVELDPAKLGGAWCAGVHAARVIEIETPVCHPGAMCPQFVRVIGTVGGTRFTVGS